MKKTFVKALSMALVAVMLVMALVSCGGPASDPDKALENLKGKEYSAAKDTLVVPIALKAAFALAKVDANVDTVISGTKAIKDKDGKTTKVESVTVVYFTDKDGAKAAWNTVKEYAEGNKKDDEKSDFVIKQSGSMIYWGTTAGVKAAG